MPREANCGAVCVSRWVVTVRTLKVSPGVFASATVKPRRLRLLLVSLELLCAYAFSCPGFKSWLRRWILQRHAMHGGSGRLAGRTDTVSQLHFKAPPSCSPSATSGTGSNHVAFRCPTCIGVINRSGNLQVGLRTWKWTVGVVVGNDCWRPFPENGGGRSWKECRSTIGRKELRVELAQERTGRRTTSLVVVSFFKIVHLPGYERLREPLRQFCEARGVIGDILFGACGINGYIYGTQETVDDVLALVESYPKLKGIWRFQFPLVPGFERIDREQDSKVPLEDNHESGFHPLRALCRCVARVFGRGKRGEQKWPSGECTRKEPALDLHLSLAVLTARNRMSGDYVDLAGALQQLEWIRVAANLFLARLLGSAIVSFISCNRDALGDPWLRFETGEGNLKSDAVGTETSPIAEIPASVPWNPVAVDSRYKWQRRNGKSISRPPRLEKVAGRTLSAASARDYSQAMAVDTMNNAQSTLSVKSFQVSAKGNSGDSATGRKKQKEKKVSQKGKKGRKSSQAGEGEVCEIRETLSSDIQTQMVEVRQDTMGIEAGLGRADVLQSLFGGYTPKQGRQLADTNFSTSKQGPEQNRRINSLNNTPGSERGMHNDIQSAGIRSRRITKDTVTPRNVSEPKAIGSNVQGSTSSGSVSGDTALDWIDQMVDQREQWITTAKKSSVPVSREPDIVNDGSPRPLEEIASSVAARLRMLQSRLVATQSALQSGRMALTQKDGYLNEIHSRASAELIRASDALEFREDELVRTIAALRKTHANAKAKALSMDLMAEHKELENLTEKNEDFQSSVPLVKRTARVIWPNPAREVAIAGSFNGWTGKVPMRKSNAGVFVASLELYPGRYEIKFVVDGSWRVDPRRPIVYDQGYENNVLIIS